jgi:hypothetical protein
LVFVGELKKMSLAKHGELYFILASKKILISIKFILINLGNGFNHQTALVVSMGMGR